MCIKGMRCVVRLLPGRLRGSPDGKHRGYISKGVMTPPRHPHRHTPLPGHCGVSAATGHIPEAAASPGQEGEADTGEMTRGTVGES